MSAILIYITTSSPVEARKIAEAVIADRLAACANILPAMTAICHWDGKIQSAEETVLILKTRAELFPAVEMRVRELHAYKIPCIVSWKLDQGHAPFMQWLLDETKP